MKKLILSFVAFTMFLAVGCSEENPTDFNAEQSSEDLGKLAGRGSVWDGEIGVVENDVFKITADEEALITDLEAELRTQGKTTELVHLEIKELKAANDPTDRAYMLIGSDAARISIGVFLERNGSFLTLDNSFTKGISCEGCTHGCHINYLVTGGKKIPFCNEMSCTYDCTQS